MTQTEVFTDRLKLVGCDARFIVVDNHSHREMNLGMYDPNDPVGKAILNFILYETNGIIEVMNENRELFGYPRLEDLLLAYCHDELSILRLKILKEIETFYRETPQDDDMTMLFIQPKPKVSCF